MLLFNTTQPRITKELVLNCDGLSKVLLRKLKSNVKYKFEVNTKPYKYSNFKMLTSNVSQVVDVLDSLRRSPRFVYIIALLHTQLFIFIIFFPHRKFNCINDNMDTTVQSDDDNKLIRALLDDFYLSLFPSPSPVELPQHYRNRFRSLDEYSVWLASKLKIMIALYALCCVMLLTGVWLLCLKKKGRLVRRFLVINC